LLPSRDVTPFIPIVVRTSVTFVENKTRRGQSANDSAHDLNARFQRPPSIGKKR
jgi:hypothetical protein